MQQKYQMIIGLLVDHDAVGKLFDKLIKNTVVISNKSITNLEFSIHLSKQDVLLFFFTAF